MGYSIQYGTEWYGMVWYRKDIERVLVGGRGHVTHTLSFIQAASWLLETFHFPFCQRYTKQKVSNWTRHVDDS